MSRLRNTILIYVVIVAAIVVGIFMYLSPVQLKNGVYVKSPQDIASFELTSHKGHTFTQAKLKGQWSLLFFGFTSCPMVCPVTLEVLRQVNENLPASKQLEIVFVSVDPERDSIEHLNKYMQPFDKHFVALTGQMADINALQKQLNVPVSTAPASHGPEIILINPQAQVQAYFRYPIGSQPLLEDLSKVIGE